MCACAKAGRPCVKCLPGNLGNCLNSQPPDVNGGQPSQPPPPGLPLLATVGSFASSADPLTSASTSTAQPWPPSANVSLLSHLPHPPHQHFNPFLSGVRSFHLDPPLSTTSPKGPEMPGQVWFMMSLATSTEIRPSLRAGSSCSCYLGASSRIQQTGLAKPGVRHFRS